MTIKKIPVEDFKVRRRRLEVDLRVNQPNKRQALYAKFYHENVGYHWKEHSTGKFLSKGMLFSRFYDSNPKALELLTNDDHISYERLLKTESFEEVIEHGIKKAKRIGVNEQK